MAIPRLTAVQTWQQWKGDLQRGVPAQLAPAARWGSDTRVAHVAEIVTHSPQWKAWQDCFGTTDRDTFGDFWRSLAPGNHTALVGLFGRRELLRKEVEPLIEPYADLVLSRKKYLADCRGWIALDLELQQTTPLAQRSKAWLASLPTSVLYFLHAADRSASEAHKADFRRRVRAALEDYSADGMAPSDVTPKQSAERPRPETLANAVRESVAWQEYVQIAEADPTAVFDTFLAALQPFERERMWEIVDNGTVFDLLLRELIEAYDTYSDMTQFIAHEIAEEEALAAHFQRRKSGVLIVDPWLHSLSLTQVLALFNATNGGFVTSCQKLLRSVANPVPPQPKTGTTIRRRVEDTPPPQKLPEPPFTVDTSYINKTLTQSGIPMYIRKLASAKIEQLPEKHQEWVLADKSRQLAHRGKFYSVRLGIKYRLIYTMNTEAKTFYIYFIGSHDDYDYATSEARTAVMQAWAVQRGIR